MNTDVIRWHARVCNRGYRTGLPPLELLSLTLASARAESTVLRAMLASVRTTSLAEIQAAPELVAHDISTCLDTHRLSLTRPETSLALETSVLAFAAALTRAAVPPPWLLRETYLGRKLRDLVLELRDPRPAGLAWRIHEATAPGRLLARSGLDAAISADRWPEPGDCARLRSVLEQLEREVELSPQQRAELALDKWIAAVLELGGPTGLFVHYMMAVIDHVDRWCRARTPQRGPMQLLADDVAAPILRMFGGDVVAHARRNRRPLHVARRKVTSSHLARRALASSLNSWNSQVLIDLEEFADHALGRCRNDNAPASARAHAGRT